MEQLGLENESEEYREFVEKFKPKKTTDDCYTPQNVYDVIAEMAAERYGFSLDDVVRPFWPGGDYERAEYPEGCVVLDNPPFSILARIKRFYMDRGIRFFLFCPSLTAFSGAITMELTTIVCDAEITYENGAIVRTAFVTNMGGDIVAETWPELLEAIEEQDRLNRSKGKATLPKYDYPYDVLTAARLAWLSKHGEHFAVRRGDCVRISKLDAQGNKTIFGGGLLLSERAAAERAAAERAAAERAAAERAAAFRFELSDREKKIQQMLGR